MATTLTTGEARLSFVTLLPAQVEAATKRAVKRDNDYGPVKPGVTLLIPKSDASTYERLMAAVKEAEDDAWENGKFPRDKRGNKGWTSKMKFPVKDGDLSDLDAYPENEGHWVVGANYHRDGYPIVLDNYKTEGRWARIYDPTRIYSGAYGRASIGAFAYNNKSVGIAFGLNAVQFIRDGEPFGAGISVESAFEDDLDIQDDLDSIM